MAHHGSHSLGFVALGSTAGQKNPIYPLIPRVVRVLGDPAPFVSGSGRDDSVGYPSGPSLSMPRGGTLRIRVPVDAGARGISIAVLQPSTTLPRPSITIRANPAVGLYSDLQASAPAGSGWVTIGPLAWTATAAGGVWIDLVAPFSGGESGTWWDNRVTT